MPQTSAHTAEIADLAAEGFNLVFTIADRETYRTGRTEQEDVLAEQARVDRAQHLVLVFPVWWWSFPALMKGWIDRVFTNGWAYVSSAAQAAGVPSNDGTLKGLTVHVVPIAAGTEGKFDRHGYLTAIETQIVHGVAEYCGAERGMLEYVWQSETSSVEIVEDRITEIAERLVAELDSARR